MLGFVAGGGSKLRPFRSGWEPWLASSRGAIKPGFASRTIFHVIDQGREPFVLTAEKFDSGNFTFILPVSRF